MMALWHCVCLCCFPFIFCHESIMYFDRLIIQFDQFPLNQLMDQLFLCFFNFVSATIGMNFRYYLHWPICLNRIIFMQKIFNFPLFHSNSTESISNIFKTKLKECASIHFCMPSWATHYVHYVFFFFQTNYISNWI